MALASSFRRNIDIDIRDINPSSFGIDIDIGHFHFLLAASDINIRTTHIDIGCSAGIDLHIGRFAWIIDINIAAHKRECGKWHSDAEHFS